MAATTATRMPGVRGEKLLEAEDDAQAQEADAERPGVGHLESLDEGDGLRDEAIRVGGEPEELGQLADEDDHRQAGQVARAHGAGEQVGHEPEPSHAGSERDDPDEERQHPGQGDGLLLAACGQRQDGRRDHRPEGGVRAQHEDG